MTAVTHWHILRDAGWDVAPVEYTAAAAQEAVRREALLYADGSEYAYIEDADPTDGAIDVYSDGDPDTRAVTFWALECEKNDVHG